MELAGFVAKMVRITDHLGYKSITELLTLTESSKQIVSCISNVVSQSDKRSFHFL